MATAQTLVDRALRLIGAIASGASPTAQESADALIALNAMIESWQGAKLQFYTLVDTAYTASAADYSYTVGPSGNFSLTPRPFSIENCFARVSDVDYPIELVSADRWFAIQSKTDTSTIPLMAYYEATLATGTLLVYPVPSESVSIHIVTGVPTPVLAALATTVATTQGGEDALAFNLAVRIAPEYPEHRDISDVKELARETKAAFMRQNQRSMIAYTELAGLFGRGRSNITSGGVIG